ncbi:MAG: S1-C subfamily serine protease, partial [Pirellulaceae bacterium]
MSVRLACPQCKHAFAPPTTAPGSEFACPSCGKTVKIAVAKQPNPAATIAASQVTPKQSHAPALPTAKPLPKSRPVASDSVQSLPRAKAADPQEILPLVKPADVQDNIPKAKPLPAKKALPPITVAKVASQDSVQELPVAPLVAAVPAFNAPIPSNPASIPVGEIIPQDPTSSGGVGFDFGGGASASSGASTIRRRPKRGLPIPLIAGIGGGALLLIVALVFVLSRPETPSSALGGGENNETTANANPDGTPIGNSATTTPATVPVVSVPTVDLDSVQREEIWGRLQHSIVRIETDGPNGKKSALGFLAGGAGWIVTNHHVIDRATKVTVTTSLNEIIESTGIIDTAPSADLAVIAVPPEKMAAGRVVRFARDWKSSKGDLVALSPSNNPTSESIVGYNFRESLSSTKLPPSSKALLREFGMDADNDDLLWLAFDGQVKDNGATGGPLVNEQGHVIGVFTVLSPSSTSGYAIPVSAVAELIDAATNDITPFGDNEIASNTDPSQPDRGEPDEGMDPDPNKFGPKEPDPNEPDPNNPFLQNVSPEWSAADIELVFNEGKEFQWDPVT